MALALATAGVARADSPGADVSLKLSAPTMTTLARETQISATLLKADGTPVSGAVIHFYAEASFAGVKGKLHLGQATTDAQGVAIFHYSPRSNGDLTLFAEFEGDNELQPAKAKTTLRVTGSPPLYRETAGIQVPGLNSWLLIAVLSGIWAILFTAGVFILSIARASSPASPGR